MSFEKCKEILKIYNITVEYLLQQIEPMLLTILMNFSKNKTNNCNDFEIFGVDFLIDKNKQLFLLEINENPDFIFANPEKENIYSRVFSVLFDFLRQKFEFIEREIKKHNLTIYPIHIYDLSCKFNYNFH